MSSDHISQIKKIIKKTFGIYPDSVSKIHGGQVSDVYDVLAGSKRYVIKFVPPEGLYNEVFFFEQAELVGVNVPHIYVCEEISDALGFYLMDFIEGHSDPDSDTEKFFELMVAGLKRIHEVRLDGFGKMISLNTSNTSFENPTLWGWLNSEVKRLDLAFEKFGREDLRKHLSLVEKTLPKFIKDTKSSCLVHGDVGFGNLRLSESRVFFIDPGWNRAVTPLWEVAYFDYKFINNPEKHYRSELFHKFYFPQGISRDDESGMAVFRMFCALECYRFYIKKSMDESVAKLRLETNLSLFKAIL